MGKLFPQKFCSLIPKPSPALTLPFLQRLCHLRSFHDTHHHLTFREFRRPPPAAKPFFELPAPGEARDRRHKGSAQSLGYGHERRDEGARGDCHTHTGKHHLHGAGACGRDGLHHQGLSHEGLVLKGLHRRNIRPMEHERRPDGVAVQVRESCGRVQVRQHPISVGMWNGIVQGGLGGGGGGTKRTTDYTHFE